MLPAPNNEELESSVLCVLPKIGDYLGVNG